MSGIKFCIVIYGVLLVTVSIALLLSLSIPESPDNVVIVETRTPSAMLLPHYYEEPTRHADTNYSLNSSESVTGGKQTSLPTETVPSTVPPFNRLSPLQWVKPSTGKTWAPGVCKDFVGSTYNQEATVCPRIKCYGSSYSKSTGTCTINGVAVKPLRLYNALKQINIKKMKTANDIIMKSNAAWLVQDMRYQKCTSPALVEVDGFLEPLDYVRPFVKMTSFLSEGSQCNRWIKGTTFFYVGMENHIYFKFLGWYNLHRSFLAHDKLTNYTVVRLPEGNNTFLFPEFEQALYPNTVRLQDLKDETVCFEELVLVPWAYAAPAFRCRIEKTLKRKCSQCDGKGIESDFKSFRRRVLAACGIADGLPKVRTKQILVVERKPYIRRLGDQAKSFTRVWENSEELIQELEKHFPQYNVSGIYAEKLTICQQIEYAHNTDIFIGMHGAGMVHLWWTEENAKIIELVPKSQRGNVAFKTLATFLGRTYKEYTKVTEKKDNTVNVNIGELLKVVKSIA